jgi:CheY-like chemotaxis protein/HPt (histidine-containing phosphotransfer) domain-containing protein
MNGVLGMAELLLRRSLGDKERYLTESIHRSGTVLLAIINDILDFSKIEAGKLQLETIPFEVRRTIQDAVDLSAPSVQKKQLTLSCQIDTHIPPYLLGDPTRLRQIIVNLVGNAVKFTAQGMIAVAVSLESQNGEEYGLAVTVRDTGIGISSDVQARIFDAFSQADGSTTRKYGGTGLGLAIVKQLVTLMGGNIELRSTPGEGSSFRFTAYFKRCDSPALTLVPTPNNLDSGVLNQQPLKPEKTRILLVEDNPVNREVACGMLETLHCHIDTAENGREAVAATAATGYSLVFMDCQMPEMDGLTATRLIREREMHQWSLVTGQSRGKDAAPSSTPMTNDQLPMTASRVPIIALTAHAMQGDRELCLAAGMDDYLTKPFTLAQLEQVLARWIPQRTTSRDQGDTESPYALAQPAGGESQPVPPQAGTREEQSIESAILDPSALAAIRVLQRPGHPDILTRIVSQYLEMSPAMVDRIRRAVLSHDAAELRASAHRLKSSSAQLGASALAADCRELEMMGANQELTRGGDVLSRLEQHYAAACVALQGELDRLRPAA